MRNTLFTTLRNQWISLVDIKHLQENTQISVKGMMEGLLPSGVNSCLLSGCEITQNGNDYTVTAGYLYHNGFVWEVEAHSLNTVNEPYWLAGVSFLDTDPIPSNNGNSTFKAHQIGKAELVNNTGQQGIVSQYDELYYLEDYLSNLAKPGKLEMLSDGSDLDMYDTDGVGIGYNIGWQLLDGRNGFPDLSGAFPMGETAANLAALAVAGSNSKTIGAANLPVASPWTVNDPGHTHGYDDKYDTGINNAGTGGGAAGRDDNYVVDSRSTTSNQTGITLNSNTGGGQSLDITPKNFKVLYRLRVA